jgi:BMFP domain-containing protein YqiC
MTERPRFFDDLAGVAGGAFSALAGIREEAESMVRARVEEAIRKLDLVKREDLEAVMEMAANARTGQEAAELRLAALEARVASMSGSDPSGGMSGSGASGDNSGASEADPASLPPKSKPGSHGGGTSEVAPGAMPPGEPGSPDPSPDGAP